MKRILLPLTIFLLTNQAPALEVVYPKNLTPTINSNSTFFIGNTDPTLPLKINGQTIDVHFSGNFAHYVKLQNGINKFTLQSGNETKTFEIKKTLPTTQTHTQANTYKPFTLPKFGRIKNNNTPLRSTPQDFGINRLAHLQEGTPISILGENNDFYKIELSPQEFGWIAKYQVVIEDSQPSKTKINNFKIYEDKDYDIFEFSIDNPIPFKIEEEPFAITLYNIDNKNGYFKLEPQINHKLIGYHTEYKDEKFTLKVRKVPEINPKTPLKNIKITLDAGHGGKEYGAISCSGKKEKDINLEITNKLYKELKKRGAKVNLTRTNDTYVGLNDRVAFANKEDSIVLISIHGNALPDSLDPNKRFGMEIYHYYNQAQPISEKILQTVTSNIDLNNGGVRQESFVLVRNTKALSILIETAYLINPSDDYKIEQDNFQNELVKNIADGIEEYFRNF